jgi:hypothetical protein
LLDFIKLSGPHSGENLCNAFVESCNDFGILEKVNFSFHALSLKIYAD